MTHGQEVGCVVNPHSVSSKLDFGRRVGTRENLAPFRFGRGIIDHKHAVGFHNEGGSVGKLCALIFAFPHKHMFGPESSSTLT